MTDIGARAPDAPAVEPGVYPTDLIERAQWLTWKPTDDGRKVPRAPYEYQDQPDRSVSAGGPLPGIWLRRPGTRSATLRTRWSGFLRTVS